jgi:hypothetical protein
MGILDSVSHSIIIYTHFCDDAAAFVMPFNKKLYLLNLWLDYFDRIGTEHMK